MRRFWLQNAIIADNVELGPRHFGSCYCSVKCEEAQLQFESVDPSAKLPNSVQCLAITC